MKTPRKPREDMTSTPKRVEYTQAPLEKNKLRDDPFFQFQDWWQEAIDNNVRLLDAVTLATVDENNFPNARIVLLKQFDQKGFVFFTNYESPKALEILKNPRATLIVFWPKVERQVRIRGICEKISYDESQKYFLTRPRGAQIGAWASNQSQKISSRDELDQHYAKLEKQFARKEITCPKTWGGFRLVPSYIEFWQGRQNRLHDRFAYDKTKNNSWQIDRLAP